MILLIMCFIKPDMEGRITTPPTTPGVQKRARQGEAEGISRPNKAKPCNSQTCGAQRLPSKAWEKHPVNAYAGEAQPLGTGAWDAKRQERMIRADFIPALAWISQSCRAKSCKVDQKEVEALETACCTADPCRMNQRPQAFPTLLHCPDSSQHHNPPDDLTERRRRVKQPQVPLLKQKPPQPALHSSADSLSDRTLPESMLPQPFAIPMGT
jgi:hypothetical protein